MAGFEFLKQINDWLEMVPFSVTAAFEAYIKEGEQITQKRVDRVCEWLAWKVNIAVERERRRVAKALYNMYQTTMLGKVMQMASAIKAFVSNPIKAIGKFASAIFSPVTVVFEWLNTLKTEIPRLANNLARIASILPPAPPNPRINYDKFKLKISTISMSTIMQDPDSLPPPEVLFPEPPKPWSPLDFAEEMNSAPLLEKKVYYEMPEGTVLPSIKEVVGEASLDDTLNS